MNLKGVFTKTCIIGVALCCGPRAMAEMGDHILLNDWILVPSVRLETLYDSNVRADNENEEEDTSFKVSTGLLINRKAENTYLVGNLWALHERFADLSGEDHTDFGESLTLMLGAVDALNFNLKQSYANTEDYDPASAKRERIKAYGAAASGRFSVSELFTASVGATYSATDYENFASWQEIAGTAGLDYWLTGKTALTLSGKVGEQDSDSYEDAAPYWEGLVGIRVIHSEKLTSHAGVGYTSFDGDFESITDPSYGVGWSWHAIDNLWINLDGKRSVAPDVTTQGVAYLDDAVTCSAILRMLERFELSLSGNYHNMDYQEDPAAPAGTPEREDETVGVSSTLRYASPQQWIDVFVTAGYEERTSTQERYEYDQTTVATGLSLYY